MPHGKYFSSLRKLCNVIVTSHTKRYRDKISQHKKENDRKKVKFDRNVLK